MPEVQLCVVCPVYRATPRDATWPQVCDDDRERIRTDLADVPDLVALTPSRVELERAAGPIVSGTPEPPAPVNLAALGVTEPRYQRGLRARPSVYAHAPADQTGLRPPIVTLDAWVADWIDTRDLEEPPPAPELSAIVAWLLDRLGWACDEHPAVDEFAADLKHMLRALRGIVRQDHGKGSPVGRCPTRLRDDTRCGTQLYADPYIDYIACRRCGTQWNRRGGDWHHLRAEQQRWDAGNEEAA